MQLNFLTPPTERLRADGAFERVLPGGALGRLRRPVLLLARELTSFALFETAALPAGRRRQAARLHARTASPYVAGGAALVKAGGDFGVWWWDLERIGPAVAARYGRHKPAIRPETMAQPPARDWRIVKLGEGYEAQLWRGGALIASVWRRERFDAASWRAFARVQRDAPDAPDAPPAAQSLPVAIDSEAFSFARSEMTRDQAIGVAAAGFATVIACVILFLLGQGVELSSKASAIEKEAEAFRADTPRADAVRSMELDRRKLAAFRQVEEQTNPVSAAGAAIGVTALHDLTPISLDAEGETLTLTLPYAAVRVADELVAEFEGSGYFYDVQPRTDGAGQSLIFEMKVRSASPPLSGNG